MINLLHSPDLFVEARLFFMTQTTMKVVVMTSGIPVPIDTAAKPAKTNTIKLGWDTKPILKLAD